MASDSILRAFGFLNINILPKAQKPSQLIVGPVLRKFIYFSGFLDFQEFAFFKKMCLNGFIWGCIGFSCFG